MRPTRCCCNLLYAAGGDPIPVERFHRGVREAVNARMGCIVDDLAGDVEQRLWRRDVTALLDALELLGAVHLEESHADDDVAHRELVALAAATTRTRRSWGSPRSGCGRCARCSWSPACTRRSWASSPTEDIEYVCVRCVGMRREVAEAELAAWVACPLRGARPPTRCCTTCSASRTRRTASWPSTRSPRPAQHRPTARVHGRGGPRTGARGPSSRVECGPRRHHF